VSADTDRNARAAAVDATLAQWRQGDCFLGDCWFVHRFAKDFPTTNEGLFAAQDDADLAEQQVVGFVVVTQTCDLVRKCLERPFVELCPLVEVDAGRLIEIEKGWRPGYAYLPLLAPRRLVADLDRVMTVEKPVVATWARVQGWTTDSDARAFALALARKRERFAFPDDFNALVDKLKDRLGDKHNKASDEGRALRELDEIRIYASPSWDSTPVDLMFHFIRIDSDITFEGRNWGDLLQGWLKLVPSRGRFKRINGHVVTLTDITAADYASSYPLDLDHLSMTTKKSE